MVKTDRRAFTASALGGTAITAALGLLLVLLSTTVLESYGWALFVGLPFVLGLLPVVLFTRRAPRTVWSCLGAGLAACGLTAALALAAAAEGGICIVMAMPLVVPVALLGSYVGYLAQRARPGRDTAVRSFAAVAAVLPLWMGLEAEADRRPVARAVTTAVVVDAPPEVVWRHVVAFPPLPRPRSALLRTGIAYPTSARIEGRGVGAVRRCRFTTGDFVEPITVWDRPRRLAFDVASQPATMRELSPWGDIHPPHVEGFLRSRRGEFRLVALPGGRTRVEGTTWYENRMWPARYWQAWSDEVIHEIHRHVLEHVEARAEGRR